MQKSILIIIFNKDKTKLLVYYDKKLGMFSFVGGSLKEGEDFKQAYYRKLFEETGLTGEDVNLEFVRENVVFFSNKHLLVNVCVLNKDINLEKEGDSLFWIPVNDADKFLSSDLVYDDSCHTFYLEACRRLGIAPFQDVSELGFKKISLLNADSVFEFSMANNCDG